MKMEKRSEWKGILVYLQCRNGKIHSSAEELIGEAERLTQISKEPVYVLGIGSDTQRIQKELEGYPVHKAYLYEAQDIYEPGLYADLTEKCIRELAPSVVLVGGTYEGRSLAPRLAVRFRTGLTADCTSLDMDEEGNLIQTRPAFGGDVMASILTEKSRPQFATVRPGIMSPAKRSEAYRPEVHIRDCTGMSGKAEIIVHECRKDTVDIRKCRLLVAAGRGIKKKEDLEMLYELARLLGGELASSRALVEKGWMPPKRQIGLSGNSVRPEYLLTVGVSGTVQFMAGMRQTKNIIAVNSDPKARIFEIAHYPICGDLYEIVPEMIKQLKTKAEKEAYEC